MAEIKLKPEHRDTIVGFNGGGRVGLGYRDDLHILMMAGFQRNKQLLQYFDEPYPSYEELVQMEEEYAEKLERENIEIMNAKRESLNKRREAKNKKVI
jgi:hypothetical protein